MWREKQLCECFRDEQERDRSGRAHSSLLKQAGYDITYMEYNGPHAWQPPVVTMAVEFFMGDVAARQAVG